MATIFELINSEYSHDEKESFKEIIKMIIKLSNKVWSDGLLSLDDVYIFLPNFLLRKGLELIIECTDVEDVEYVLDNYINAREYSNSERLERVIIKKSVLLLQKGDTGKILFDKILSILGESFFEKFEYVEGW